MTSPWLKGFERIPSLVYIIVAIILFFLVLSSGFFPESLLKFFHEFSIFLFILSAAIYYFSFRLPGKIGWFVGLLFVLLFFALTLLYKWTSGFSDNWVIGGLIPYKDARHYYQAVQMVLVGEPIPILSYQPAERPLNPGFMSFLFLLTNSNLKWTLAIVVLITGISAYLAARCVLASWGPLAASIFLSLLHLYARDLIGLLNSELPGLITGCLGFVVLWRAAKGLKPGYLYLGSVILMLSFSARPGAFFIFPLLTLWAGWVFREKQRFSIKTAGITALVVSLAFLIFNVIYPRLVVEPGRVIFSNFAFMIYGQVRGGTGWTEGFGVTGTKNPEVIFNYALDFFRRHPLSLFIGFAKSYRDFFHPRYKGIFPFGEMSTQGTILWVLGLILLVIGLTRAFKRRHEALFFLLIACFIGILLSIPFLPPIDGGNRFYAGTMALFFAVVIIPLITPTQKDKWWGLDLDRSVYPAAILGSILVVLTVFTPIYLQHSIELDKMPSFGCPGDQEPFVIKLNPESHVDLIKDNELCGIVPNICLSDFQENGTHAVSDDFYQELEKQAVSSKVAIRIYPNNNLIDSRFHFFVGAIDQFKTTSSDQLMAGCATEIRTEHQSIYNIESVVINSVE
jgi:hypothetical protein